MDRTYTTAIVQCRCCTIISQCELKSMGSIHEVRRKKIFKKLKNGKDLDEPINNVINGRTGVYLFNILLLLLLYWAHDVIHNAVYKPILVLYYVGSIYYTGIPTVNTTIIYYYYYYIIIYTNIWVTPVVYNNICAIYNIIINRINGYVRRTFNKVYYAVVALCAVFLFCLK